jgi:polyisoprenoid-binding protein YceI
MSLKTVIAVIKGSSTLHDWESAITEIAFQGSLYTENVTAKAIKDVVVTIPVKSIKSKEGKLMDSKTYEAFKADTYPAIVFSVSQAAITIDGAKNITITAPGKLSMAGATRQVVVSGTGKVLANGDWRITVSQKIIMTQFAMKPPTVMMGTIKVGDEVTVSVDFTLTPSGIASNQ